MAREYRFAFILSASITAAFIAFANVVRETVATVAVFAREVFVVAFPSPAAPRVETPLPGVAWVLGLFQTRSFRARLDAREPDRQVISGVRAFA